MSEISPDHVLDARNLSCPLPLMKTVKEMRRIEEGKILEVLSTDPGSLVDIPKWAEKMGHKVLKAKKEGEVVKVCIRKRSH